MQSSLGVLVVIAMVREGFHFLGMLGWYKTRESWKPEGNIPHLLHDRFAKGEEKKDGDSVGLCKNVWCDKCTIIPSDERPSHDRHKSLQKRQCQCTEQKHVRWICVMFYLFNFAQPKYKTMYYIK